MGTRIGGGQMTTQSTPDLNVENFPRACIRRPEDSVKALALSGILFNITLIKSNERL